MNNNFIHKIKWNKSNLTYIKTALYAFAVIAVVFIVQIAINYSFQDEKKMVDAFSGAQSDVVKSQLQVVGNYGNKYMTQEDKEQMIDYVSGKLGIAGKLEKKVVQGNKTTSITANITGEKSNTTIESISVEYEMDNEVIETSQYIYVTIEIYEEVNSILYYKNIIEDTFRQMDLDSVDTSISFQGEYKQMLTLKEKNEITDEILSVLQGKVVKDNRSDTMFTVYAYTPMIDEYISVDKNRVNVNVAFSYDEEAKRTMLYMASPVISFDY